MSYNEITAQTIRALAAIDDALGLPQDGCNSTSQTLAAIRTLRLDAERFRFCLERGFPTRQEWKGNVIWFYGTDKVNVVPDHFLTPTAAIDAARKVQP